MVGDPSNAAAWQTRCGFRYGGLSHMSVSLTRGIAECFCARSSHAQPNVAPIMCWSILQQFHWCTLHRSSHTLGRNQERWSGSGTLGGPTVVIYTADATHTTITTASELLLLLERVPLQRVLTDQTRCKVIRDAPLGTRCVERVVLNSLVVLCK